MMKCKHFPILYLAACGLMFAACSQPQQAVNYSFPGAKAAAGQPQAALTAAMLSDYLYVKDALVATNAAGADKWSKAMKVSVERFREQLPMPQDTTQQAGSDVLRRGADSMLQQLDAMLMATNSDCELKRIHFKPISDILYATLRNTGMQGIHAYRHYCPMAMNERGAYWISTSPDIENPYFGQKMLTCGELVDTIN